MADQLFIIGPLELHVRSSDAKQLAEAWETLQKCMAVLLEVQSKIAEVPKPIRVRTPSGNVAVLTGQERAEFLKKVAYGSGPVLLNNCFFEAVQYNEGEDWKLL